MARKKTTFGWVRDEPEGVEEEAEEEEVFDPSNRRDHGQREELERLAKDLAALPPSARRTLPLEPWVLDEVEALATVRPSPARRRLLLRVKSLLRDLGPETVEALEAVVAGDTPQAARARELERWRDRLLTGGDDALQAFVDAHPAADRQRLRALVREARGEGEAATRAARRLYQALKDA